MRHPWRVCELVGLSHHMWDLVCPSSQIPPMLSCFHTSSTVPPLFSLLFWGMSFGEMNSNKVVSHRSLLKNFLQRGSAGETDPLCVPFLAGFTFSEEGTHRQRSRTLDVTNKMLCLLNGRPRQDILEARVERALPVYRERALWQRLFSQWLLKSSYQYKSLLFLWLESLREVTVAQK